MKVHKHNRALDIVRGFLAENEGKEITVNRIFMVLKDEPICKKYKSGLLAFLHKELEHLYRVDHGTYIYDTQKKHKEHTSRYDQIIALAEANDGKVTIDMIIEHCSVVRETAYSLLDQLKHGKGYAPHEYEVERVSYYSITKKETADV